MHYGNEAVQQALPDDAGWFLSGRRYAGELFEQGFVVYFGGDDFLPGGKEPYRFSVRLIDDEWRANDHDVGPEVERALKVFERKEGVGFVVDD